LTWLRADLHTEIALFRMSTVRKLLVVRARCNKSSGSKCPKIWFEKQEDRNLVSYSQENQELPRKEHPKARLEAATIWPCDGYFSWLRASFALGMREIQRLRSQSSRKSWSLRSLGLCPHVWWRENAKGNGRDKEMLKTRSGTFATVMHVHVSPRCRRIPKGTGYDYVVTRSQRLWQGNLVAPRHDWLLISSFSSFVIVVTVRVAYIGLQRILRLPLTPNPLPVWRRSIGSLWTLLLGLPTCLGPLPAPTII
jgi:hypothetical protein